MIFKGRVVDASPARSMLAPARDARWAVCDDFGMEYVSRVPGLPLERSASLWNAALRRTL
jgi:hypothetical protein